MNSPHRLHLSLATAAFAVSAIAGWCSVREPDKPKAGVPALARAASPAGAARAAGAPVAALPALERALLEALDPSSRTFSGERLAELCLEDFPAGLPGQDPATAYAWHWAAKDPRGMYAWFMQHGGTFTLPRRSGNPATIRHERKKTSFLNDLFSEWAQKDARAAATAALACANPVDAAGALILAIKAMRKPDPARAAALAAEHVALLSSSPIHFDADGADYRDTWDFLRALPAGKDRDVLLVRYFDEVMHDQGSGPQLWKDLPDDMRRGMVAAGLTGRVMSAGGDEGLLNLEGVEDLRRAYVETSRDPRVLYNWLNTSGRDWALHKPAEAIAWAQEHLKGEPRVTATATLFRAAAVQNFDVAVREWQALPEGVLRDHAAGNLAAGAPSSRKDEVEALLATLPPSEQSAARATQEQVAPQEASLMLFRMLQTPRGRSMTESGKAKTEEDRARPWKTR